MIKQQIEVNGIGSNLRTSSDFDYNAENFFFANHDADINKCW